MVIIIILKKLLLIMSIFLLQILFPEMLNVYFPLFRFSAFLSLSSFHAHNFSLYYTTPARRFPTLDAMVISG